MGHALTLAWGTIVKMVDGFFMELPNLLVGFIVGLTFLWIGRLSKGLSTQLASKARVDHTLANALGTLTSFLIYIIGMLIVGVVVIPHFSMVNVIGGLGISSVAIGFAFKDILQNFFAGMLLLWQKPFRIGDTIRTKDSSGIVEDITIRSTLLRTEDNELVFIPNGDIYTSPIVVSASDGKRKNHLAFSLKSEEPLGRVREKILGLLSEINDVQSNPKPTVWVADTNLDTLSFDIYYWTERQPEKVLTIKDKVTSALRQHFSNSSSVRKVA